jgi:hypothetical protein
MLPEDLPDDPELMHTLRRLRRECLEAKEKLSHQTAVTIHVGLTGMPASIRMTRAELEDLIGPSIRQTVDCLERAVDHAGVSAAELAAVVLVGGSARIPLVSEQVSHRLGRPVAISPQPKLCVAMGAALLPDLISVPSATHPAPSPPAPAPTTPPVEQSPFAPAVPGSPVEGSPFAPAAPGSSVQQSPLASTADTPPAQPSPFAAPRLRRSGGYVLAAVVLFLIGVAVAVFGPTSAVDKVLTWNVDGSRTTALPAGTAATAQLTPTFLGVDLPGDPMKLDRSTRTFEIGSGYKLFLAGPVVGVVQPPGDKLLLTRSGGAWWSPFATIPGGAMILGILFSIAYAEALLRELRSQRGRIRVGQLTGMIGVGLVAGVVAALATWIGGRLLSPASAVLVVVSIAASVGLLAFVPRPSSER